MYQYFSCILQLQMGDNLCQMTTLASEAREWQHICLNEIFSITMLIVKHETLNIMFIGLAYNQRQEGYCV
jgi:hypothetical protein